MVPFQRARLPASPHKKKHITVIGIIRAHRGRDFTCGLTGIRELRAPIANLRRHRKKTEKTRTPAKTTPKKSPLWAIRSSCARARERYHARGCVRPRARQRPRQFTNAPGAFRLVRHLEDAESSRPSLLIKARMLTLSKQGC